MSDRDTDQTRPDVEARSSGGFLVVWESQQESDADSVPLGGSKGGKDSAGSDDNESGIFGRRVNILGRAEGSELRLNSAQLVDPARPAVAADGSGQLLVVWDAPRSEGSENRKIVGQLVSEDGELVGDELALSQGTGSRIEPDVSFDSEIERYLVVWRQLDSVDGGIGGRVFDADGEPLEEELLIGVTGDGQPQVASQEAGLFSVVWERAFGDTILTFGQLIDEDGEPLGSPFPVSDSTSRNRLSFPPLDPPEGTRQERGGEEQDEEGTSRPAVAFQPSGTSLEEGTEVFFVAWVDRLAEDQEILTQRFAVTADLELVVADEPDPVLVSDPELRYTVTVTNASAADAEDVTVLHEFPASLTLSSSSGCAEDPAAATTCGLGTIPGGGAAQYTLTAEIGPELPVLLLFQALVDSPTPDPDTGDNFVAEPTAVGQADLSIEVAPATELTIAGTPFGWEVTVHNAGPSPADDVVITAELAPGVRFPVTSGCAEDPDGLPVCSLGTLARGEERRVDLSVELAAGLEGTVSQTVQVDALTIDDDLDNNTAGAAAAVGSAELAVTLEAPAELVAGNVLTYTITVVNNGNAPAEEVAIQAPLPAGLTLVASNGCGEDPAGAPTCTLSPSGDQGETLGTVHAGGSRQVRLDVAVDAGLTGTLRFEVSVTSLLATDFPTASAETTLTASSVLPLLDGRFAVRVDFPDQQAGAGEGRAITFSDNTGFFWFFNPDNVELVVKVLDGGPFNGFFWFFYGGLSDIEYTITVTDTETGAERTYHNPPGEICGQGDIRAFPGADGLFTLEKESTVLEGSRWEKGAACVPGAANLCLNGGRFRVDVAWQDERSGNAGIGQATLGTDDTGYFWFFNSENLELAVKVLDGRAFNGKFWVFYGGLSDVGYTITVTDTETGASRSYSNPQGEVCGRADTGAF